MSDFTEKVRAMVEAAYREGHEDGYRDGTDANLNDETMSAVDRDWKRSDALSLLDAADAEEK